MPFRNRTCLTVAYPTYDSHPAEKLLSAFARASEKLFCPRPSRIGGWRRRPIPMRLVWSVSPAQHVADKRHVSRRRWCCIRATDHTPIMVSRVALQHDEDSTAGTECHAPSLIINIIDDGIKTFDTDLLEPITKLLVISLHQPIGWWLIMET